MTIFYSEIWLTLYERTKLFVYVNYFLYLCSVFNEYRYA